MLRQILNKWKHMPVGLKSALVYTTATVFSRGLAIITTPIFTRIMSTAQIGTVSLYNSWYSLISAIATLSLTSGGFAVAMKEYSDQRDQYQSSILSLTSLIAAILAIVYFICPSFWNHITGLPTQLMILMLIGFVVAPARDFWLARQRYEYKYKLAGIVVFSSAIIASVISVLTVLTLNKSENADVAAGRLWANYSIVYGVAAFIWISIFAKGKTFFNGRYWLESLKISIPLVGYSIAAQVLSVSDRMMISSMVSNHAVGIYSTLYTVSSLSLLVWQAINTSFIPYLFQNINKPENNIPKVSLLLLASYSCIAILFTLLAPEIVAILATSEYYEAIYIMPPIAAGVYFTSVANMYSNIAVYYKKSKYVMYPAVIAAVSNVILNRIFIPVYGYMAAAYTTLFSYVLLAALQAVWANRVHKNMQSETNCVYADKKILFLSIVTIAITLLGIILYRNTLIRYSVIVIGTVICGVLMTKVLGWRKEKRKNNT